MNPSLQLDRVPVRQLLRTSLEFDTEEKPERLELGEDGPRWEGSIRLHGALYAVDGEVIVNAHLEANQAIPCSRCLDEIHKPDRKDLMLSLEIGNKTHLNLLPYFREELLMDQPLHVLCREDCKGLCARCGVNLNHQACVCEKKKNLSKDN